MNKSENSPRLRCALARGCEKGFTLLEILVTLAILTILIAIAAGAFGGRATDTRLTSIASQAAQVIQSRQNLFANELRNTKIRPNELAGSFNTVLSEIDGITSVTADTGACDPGATNDSGIRIVVAAPLINNDAEAQNLQALLVAAINESFVGAPTGAGYTDVFARGDGTAVTASSATDERTANATQIDICFDG